MQHPELPLQQRVRSIVRMFDERTAHEPSPLSRERIRQVIEQVVAAVDAERRRESEALLSESSAAEPSFPDHVSAGGCNCS